MASTGEIRTEKPQEAKPPETPQPSTKPQREFKALKELPMGTMFNVRGVVLGRNKGNSIQVRFVTPDGDTVDWAMTGNIEVWVGPNVIEQALRP